MREDTRRELAQVVATSNPARLFYIHLYISLSAVHIYIYTYIGPERERRREDTYIHIDHASGSIATNSRFYKEDTYHFNFGLHKNISVRVGV
jgi:hypothetical protein